MRQTRPVMSKRPADRITGLAARSHVTREQTLHVTISEDDIERDVDTVRVVLSTDAEGQHRFRRSFVVGADTFRPKPEDAGAVPADWDNPS